MFTSELLYGAIDERFEEMSIALIGNCPLEFSATIKAELPKWAGLTRAAGIKIDPP